MFGKKWKGRGGGKSKRSFKDDLVGWKRGGEMASPLPPPFHLCSSLDPFSFSSGGPPPLHPQEEEEEEA